MTVAAIIVAAGRGLRMGADRPKPFLPLGGRTVLARAVAAFASHPRIAAIVVPVADPAEARAALGDLAGRVRLVTGGAERQDSVRRGLDALGEAKAFSEAKAFGEAEIILIHDAARPLVPAWLIDAVIDAAAAHGAAVPGLAIPDTVKRVASDGAITGTVWRDDLRLAQTPQGFRAGILRAAYDEAERLSARGTDDASLVERCGGMVRLIPGSPRNIKITLPEDLLLAEALLALPPEEVDRG